MFLAAGNRPQRPAEAGPALGTALFLARPAPHAVILNGLHGETQAFSPDLAAGADRLCHLQLRHAGSARIREEQLGI